MLRERLYFLLKITGAWLLLSAVMLLPGCVLPGPPVTPGTYVSRTTGEKLVITPSKVFIDLKVRTQQIPDRATRYVGEYDYLSEPPNVFRPQPHTSGEAVNLCLYRWHWEGTRLIRTSMRKEDRGTQVVFRPVP